MQCDPVNATIARASLVPHSERNELTQAMHRALNALRNGTGHAGHWCNMADAMNVAERLAEAGIANDHAAEFTAAQQALAAVHTRQSNGGSYTLTGPEIHALHTAAELHEVQLELCTQGELFEAIATVQRRVAQALAGNSSPTAIVCVAGALRG